MSSHQFYYKIDMMDCTRTYAYIYGFLVDDARCAMCAMKNDNEKEIERETIVADARARTRFFLSLLPFMFICISTLWTCIF